MTDFHGTYTWHYIDNKDNIVGPVENHQYLICVENIGSPDEYSGVIAPAKR